MTDADWTWHPGNWPRYPMMTRWQRARQRVREAWWILTGRHSLHRAWQFGHDQGIQFEYRRLITNKAYIAEVSYRGPPRALLDVRVERDDQWEVFDGPAW